ncbi:MAG: hypothetical protein U0350_01500 [Caldilineaceae bacterium]
MTTQGYQATNKVVLDKRLDDIGWGLLLLLTGGALLLPGWNVPVNLWLIGFGLILLGINWIRRLKGIEMRGFSIALGLLALAGGLAGFLGVELPLFALFLVLVGVGIVLKPLFENGS